MKHNLILAFLLVGTLTFAQQPPKHEVRAAWVTAVYGLDWPHTRAITHAGIRRQQEELIDILDRLKEANFNTVLFQTRTRGDVLYRSDIEPFNAILTGTPGGDPGYDPLQFAVTECHKRGMECHAWMVALPLGNRKHVASLRNSSVTKRHPSICVPYKREYFLNPGNPETKEYLMSLVREVVTRYDVDGVHFDYLRYPERAANRFPDSYDFRRYGKGRTLQQWRTDNISEILRHIYKGVKAIKPWVKVSTSPVGKYRDTSRYSSRGWNALETVHQDVQGWLAEGIQDQIYPMMYFRGNHFYPFALDWEEQSAARHVVPGLGIYFLDPAEGNWSLDEIERQMNFVRTHGLAGQAHYRVKYLMNNTRGVTSLLETRFYSAPALVPPMPWLSNTPPQAPSQLQITNFNSQAGDCIKLTWTPPSSTLREEREGGLTYVIYASDTYPVDTANPENIIAQRVMDTTYIYAPVRPWTARRFFAVTATDRYGNESPPVHAQSACPRP